MMAHATHPGPASGLVDATGTARRLQALTAFGWTAPALARRLHKPTRIIRCALHGHQDTVPAEFASLVRGVYDEIWDVWGGSPAAAESAGQNNWPPPLGWDDDDADGHGIDDPAATAAPNWKRERADGQKAGATVEDLLWWLTHGDTQQQTAWRFGISLTALQQALSRHRRAAAGSPQEKA